MNTILMRTSPLSTMHQVGSQKMCSACKLKLKQISQKDAQDAAAREVATAALVAQEGVAVQLSQHFLTVKKRMNSISVGCPREL